MHSAIHLLILEDEPVLCELLKQALSSEGFHVFAAGSRQEAEVLLDLAGWQTFDLVLSDAHLCRDPDRLEGYAFHAHWKAQHPVPPFVFMLGLSQQPLLHDDSCQIHHLLKPFRFQQLLALIRCILCLA